MSPGHHRPIERLAPEEREDTGEVWLCCRFCGAEIPASSRGNAYCDQQCKSRNHSQETGL